MKKKIIIIVALLISIFVSPVKALTDDYYTTMKQDILCLMMAYPEYITDVEKSNDGKVYVVTKSGKKILYDDKNSKSFQQKMYDTDLQDMLEQLYPIGIINGVMEKDFDPGRIRSYSLLKEVYGGDRKSIESNLKMANLAYRRFQFNGNNNASKSLENAVKELMPISQKNPNVSKALFPSSGTFNYRCISGTSLLSPHSFGIAIDLARDRRDYWKWVSKEEGDKRIQEYPKEIIDTFEKNGFVWGGKWSHFDILHFEYRPEIILKSRYFGQKNSNDKFWYSQALYNDKLIKGYIQKIDEKLQ